MHCAFQNEFFYFCKTFCWDFDRDCAKCQKIFIFHVFGLSITYFSIYQKVEGHFILFRIIHRMNYHFSTDLECCILCHLVSYTKLSWLGGSVSGPFFSVSFFFFPCSTTIFFHYISSIISHTIQQYPLCVLLLLRYSGLFLASILNMGTRMDIFL